VLDEHPKLMLENEFCTPKNKNPVPVGERHSAFHQAMVKVLSQEVTSLSLKQRKNSNMGLMHLLFRKPLSPQISPKNYASILSYQNSIVLNAKTKPEKNTLFLPTSQSFLSTQDFFGSQDTRCTSSMS